MTHRKKLTIFFLAFATLFTCMLHVRFYQGNGQGNRLSNLYKYFTSTSSSFSTDYSSELSSKLLRFRVLANSDSEKDQNVKTNLAKEVVSLLSPALSGVQTKEEAITLVRKSLPFLTAYCNTMFSDKSVTCTLGPHLFPYKTYGNYQFPSGIYDTLLVTIGNGRGSNWWCLAFPPLCFADEAFLDVPEPSAQMLMDVLDEDCYHAIVRNPNAQENLVEKPTLTFGLFSLLERLFD